MPELSDTARSIMTILNNVNELIFHDGRSEAVDALKALKVYADNRNFSLPDEKFENFYAVVLDSRQHTLTALVFDLVSDVLVTEQELKRK